MLAIELDASPIDKVIPLGTIPVLRSPGRSHSQCVGIKDHPLIAASNSTRPRI